MDWISSLLGTNCPFCRVALGSPRRACRECARAMAAIELAPAVHASVGRLPVVAVSEYEGWLRALVLSQKKVASRWAVRWLAERLEERIPADWRGVPLAWVPGRSLSGMHLVEWLALELQRHGRPLASGSYLTRALQRRPQQKSLSESQRLGQDMRAIFKVGMRRGRRDREVILLDDVVTTGATVTGCAAIMKERLGVEVRGALAVAFTPRSYSRMDGLSSMARIVRGTSASLNRALAR